MTKKFYIETYGCQMNVADSEVVAAILQTTDAELTEQWEDADIILLNTCSIREKAEETVCHRLQEIKALLAKSQENKCKSPENKSPNRKSITMRFLYVKC